MYICPTIQSSCCSMYDQFTMYQTWKSETKPKLVGYYNDLSS